MAIQHKQQYAMQSSNTIIGDKFEVEADAKLFATLTATLYTDKETAVPREMICNMRDAHIERNSYFPKTVSGYATSVYAAQLRKEQDEKLADFIKWLAPADKMYELTVPTELSPTMEFKDFGIGLPVDKIMGPVQTTFDEETKRPIIMRDEKGHPVRRGGLYKTLFKSTKEFTNAMTGAYGLGSKSPYALCDTFIVESRYNGEKHIYIMYMDNDRQPLVNWVTKNPLTGEPAPMPNDEYNGLTVSMVIQNDQVERVRESVKKVLSVFPQEWQPVLKGMKPVELIDRTASLGSMYIQPDKKYKNPVHYAVMGCVAYPIQTHYLDNDITNILDEMGTDTYTEFPLGTLNVPPSREQLDYVEWTIKNLNFYMSRNIEKIQTKVAEELIHEMAQCANKPIFERYNVRTKLVKRYGTRTFQLALEAIYSKDRMFFNGLEGGSLFKLPRVSHSYFKRTKQEDPYTGETKLVEVETQTSSSTLEYYIIDTLNEGLSKNKRNNKTLTLEAVASGINIIFMDTKVRAPISYHSWLREEEKISSYSTYVVLSPTEFLLKDPNFTGDVRQYLNNTFGEANIKQLVFSSEHPQPAKLFSRTASSGISLFIGGTSNSYESWQKVTPAILEDNIFNDLDNDGNEEERQWVYVNMHGFDCTDESVTIGRINSLYHHLGLGSGKNKKYRGILAIRKSAKSIFEQNKSKLVHYDEVIKEMMSFKTNAKLRSYMKSYYFDYHMRNEVLQDVYFFGKLFGLDVKWMSKYECIESKRNWYNHQLNILMTNRHEVYPDYVNRDMDYWNKQRKELDKLCFEAGISFNGINRLIREESEVYKKHNPWLTKAYDRVIAIHEQLKEMFPKTIGDDVYGHSAHTHNLLHNLEIEIFLKKNGFEEGSFFKNAPLVSKEERSELDSKTMKNYLQLVNHYTKK